jgi:hypothetical protein
MRISKVIVYVRVCVYARARAVEETVKEIRENLSSVEYCQKTWKK